MINIFGLFFRRTNNQQSQEQESPTVGTCVVSVLNIDTAGYSQRIIEEQIAVKERFNSVLSEALVGVAADDRIILDTDNAAFQIRGDPEDRTWTAAKALKLSSLGNNPSLEPR